MDQRPAPGPIKLDAKQERKWIETRTKFLYDCPMFAHLLYTMLSRDEQHAVFSDDVKGAIATDDAQIFVKPKDFLDRPVHHRVFMLGHVVIHAMLGHNGMREAFQRAGQVSYPDGKVIPFDPKVFERATDLYTNAMLVEADIGEIPSDAEYDPQYTSKMSTLDVYRAVYEANEDGSGKEPQDNFDEHMPPGTGDGKSPTQAMQDRNEDEWATAVQAGMSSARVRGMLPASLEEALGLATEPVVDWQTQITTLFARRVGTGTYDWRQPDKRMISRPMFPVFAPRRRGFGAKLIVVAGDSSGSINKKTAAHYLAEMGKILEDLNPERIMFVWCDARTHGWEEVVDATDLERVAHAGVKGRGGTDFRPVFNDIEEMGLEPDALVYLTDGYGSFPNKTPDYTVIWGDTTGDRSMYPFGDVVHIPVQMGDDE